MAFPGLLLCFLPCFVVVLVGAWKGGRERTEGRDDGDGNKDDGGGGSIY